MNTTVNMTLSQLFLGRFAAIKFHFPKFQFLKIKLIRLNLAYPVFVMHPIKYTLNMICKSSDSVFIDMKRQRPNLIGIGFVPAVFVLCIVAAQMLMLRPRLFSAVNTTFCLTCVAKRKDM